MQQARPRAALEEAVGAGAQQERALQRGDGAVHRPHRGERAVVAAVAVARAAVLEDLRRPVIAGDQDVGERLVVAQQHVEARAQPLDEVGFEQQRLGFGPGRDEFERGGGGDHALDPRVVAGRPRIGGDAFADVLGLSNTYGAKQAQQKKKKKPFYVLLSRTKPWRTRPKHGPENGGNTAEAGRSGTAWRTIRMPSWFTSVQEMAFRGRRKFGKGRERQPLDNLYVASILAIDVDTGELKWHFQCTPGDEWDYDAIQHLMLADIQINGRNRKVIMQVNKNGYFYVLDRITGEFISGEPVAPVNWATGLDPTNGASQRQSGCSLLLRARCHSAALASAQHSADGFQSGNGIGLCPDLGGQRIHLYRSTEFPNRARVPDPRSAHPRNPSPGATSRFSSSQRTGAAGTTRHLIRMGPGDAERTVVCSSRRPQRGRSAHNRQ